VKPGADIVSCWYIFGYIGEVMTILLHLYVTVFRVFTQLWFLLLKFVLWQEYGLNGQWKLLTLKVYYKPVILKLFVLHSPLLLFQHL
jgi:hypothetical protein